MLGTQSAPGLPPPAVPETARPETGRTRWPGFSPAGPSPGLSVIFITHDLGVVAAIAEQVQVLHDGAICEAGTAGQILGHPQHEYTQRLLAAAPSLSAAIRPAPQT